MNHSDEDERKKDPKVYQLLDIIAEEVSDVDRAANRRSYLVVKRRTDMKTKDQLGAEVVDYPMRAKCCGGTMMLTAQDAALKMCRDLLQGAVDDEADVVICACPLCEMSLEGYQPRVNAKYGTQYEVPVAYFTQILGYALGIDEKTLGIDKQIVSLDKVLAAVPA